MTFTTPSSQQTPGGRVLQQFSRNFESIKNKIGHLNLELIEGEERFVQQREQALDLLGDLSQNIKEVIESSQVSWYTGPPVDTKALTKLQDNISSEIDNVKQVKFSKLTLLEKQLKDAIEEDKTAQLSRQKAVIEENLARELKRLLEQEDAAAQPQQPVFDYAKQQEIAKAYKTLGVTRSDTKKAIKKKYHKLVKKYHPGTFLQRNPQKADQSKDDYASRNAAKFKQEELKTKEATEAYKLLKDEDLA